MSLIQDSNSMSKIDKSNLIMIDALNQIIRTKFPNLILMFVEDDEATITSYTVKLQFSSIRYLDNDRIILSGELTIAGKVKMYGTIEYQFNSQNFYRVSYSDKTTRSRKIHKLIPHSTRDINELLSFISLLENDCRDMKVAKH